MRVAASVGVGFWVLGAVLLFLVPGGLWSDIPGGALLALGVVIELLFTAAIFAGRVRQREG